MTLKKNDHILIEGIFYIVEWIDDSGQTTLIGLKKEDGKNVVLSTDDCEIIKVEVIDA